MDAGRGSAWGRGGVRAGGDAGGWYHLFDDNALHHVDVVVQAVRGCAAGNEPGLEEAVRAELDVRDGPAHTARSLHRLSHPLRRRVPARQIVLVSHC